MKFTLAVFMLTIVLNLSCSDSSRSGRVPNEIDNNKLTKNKPPSSFSDTITINFPAAVFYNPDSLQREKIKALFTRMEFESTVHECFYQMRNAQMSLKEYWPQIRIIETSKARFLLFIKSDHGKIYVDLNTKTEMCGLFLFNQVKDPQLADMTNIGTELDFYFLK